MSVYFIEAAGLIKVGYSADVEARTRTILSAYEDGGKVLGVLPGDRDLERFFHRKFAAHRKFGEWFEPTDEMRQLIALMTADAPKLVNREFDTILAAFEDKFCEDSAECLHRVISVSGETADEALRRLSEATGVAAKRLRKIHDGEVDHVTAAEYSICRAFGQTAGQAKITDDEIRDLLNRIAPPD